MLKENPLSVTTKPRLFSWLTAQDRKRAWRTLHNYYLTLPRIKQWHFPYWAEAPSPVAIHIVTGRDDWLLACWTLASWLHFSRTSWKIRLHDDGTLPREADPTFYHLFPGIEVIRRDQADSAMADLLHPFPRSALFRAAHPVALKIFDVPHFAGSDRVILLDSDLLFFGKPVHVMEWARSGRKECLFLENQETPLPRQEPELPSGPAEPDWSHLNTGLSLCVNAALKPSLCENILGENPFMEQDGRLTVRRLFSACAREIGARLLPWNIRRPRADREYLLAAKHYSGPDRELFFSEGLQRLGPLLFHK